MAGKNIANNKKNNISPPARKIRIAVVDDHPVVLEGLAQLVNSEDDFIVCVKAYNEKEVFDAIKKHQVDLVIVDMLLEKTSGVQVTEKLKAQYPSLHILILSMSDDLHHVKGAFQAGARGYITKDEVSEKIIAGIRKVLKGGIYVSKKLSQKFPMQTIVSWILEADAKDTLDEV
jgi:DNA-binding NarL/FixJ family response regulator